MIKVNNEPINITMFSDNTSQVWKLPENVLSLSEVDVEWNFESEGEFLHLAQLKALLDQYNVKANLYIPFLPYARQDKKVNNNLTFALQPFIKLINSLKFEYIQVLDPHPNTSVLREIWPEVGIILPDKYITNAKKSLNIKESNLLICYPDAGAKNRYHSIRVSCITAHKVRDQRTGEILKQELEGDPKDKDILIVDDICDAGGTFIGLAKLLLTNGAKSVNLYVTHGIFSKGLRPLKESGISRIFTKDGEIIETHGNITIIPFKEI